MQIAKLIEGVEVAEQYGSLQSEISELIYDSRKVSAGSAFFAVQGTLSDGHIYIDQAIKAGALLIVCESLPAERPAEVCFIRVKDSARALGHMASNFYHKPSSNLKLLGITGTNGKTTIATLLFKLFKSLGYKAGLISTVENYIVDRIVPATHTTPNPVELNALLAEMVHEGCDYCFMEVSSHAVVQERIAGLEFAGGVFSNLSHDHLDFHKTFDQYIQAKKTFFDTLPKYAFALTNSDDKNGLVMLQNTKAYKKTYALSQLADFKAKVIENSFSGLHLMIDQEDVYFKLVGSFNAYNLLAVYATAILLEQDKLTVLTHLSSLSGAEGRFDYILSPEGKVAIVDYAHTPDALENVLSTIHNIRKGDQHIITVVGCGGDRDKTKRPEMAKIACNWSDKTILTSDNPRTEDPKQILNDMEAGVPIVKRQTTLNIVDRYEAIKTACLLAQAGDIILVAGKGHEKYQEIHGQRNHFDDKEIITEQFNRKG